MTNAINSVAGVDDFATMVKDLMAERDKLQADLTAARALLYRAYPYVEDADYASDEMRLAKSALLSDIDAALAGEKR